MGCIEQNLKLEGSGTQLSAISMSPQHSAIPFMRGLFRVVPNGNSAERIAISLRLALWVHHLGLPNNHHESPLQQQAQEITRIFPPAHLPDNAY